VKVTKDTIIYIYIYIYRRLESDGRRM
jgi:hypothetical protein